MYHRRFRRPSKIKASIIVAGIAFALWLAVTYWPITLLLVIVGVVRGLSPYQSRNLYPALAFLGGLGILGIAAAVVPHHPASIVQRPPSATTPVSVLVPASVVGGKETVATEDDSSDLRKQPAVPLDKETQLCRSDQPNKDSHVVRFFVIQS